MKRLLIPFLPLLILISCKQDFVDPDSCEEIIRDNDLYTNALSDEFELVEARIEGDCMIITAQYGGGCEEVDFDLVAINGSTFSIPPQIPMRLILDDDDWCEALVTVELRYDLRALRDQAPGRGTLMMDLEGVGEMLEYSY